MPLLEQLQSLRDKFDRGRADTEDIAVIDGWVEEAKKLFLLKSLAEHDGIKYLLVVFLNEIEKINEQLLKASSKELSDKERDRMIDRRDLAQKYLNVFLPIEGELERLSEKVRNA